MRSIHGNVVKFIAKNKVHCHFFNDYILRSESNFFIKWLIVEKYYHIE